MPNNSISWEDLLKYYNNVSTNYPQYVTVTNNESITGTYWGINRATYTWWRNTSLQDNAYIQKQEIEEDIQEVDFSE